MSTTLAVPSNNLLNPIAATPTSAANAASAASGGNQTLGATDFLSLLTTELKNQDPLNPVDSTQSIAQLAQFSALQATTSLSNNFATFQSNFAVTQASGLLGESVTVASTDASGNASTATGTVSSIQVVNGAPQFAMTDASGQPIVDGNGNPVQFQTSQITNIKK